MKPPRRYFNSKNRCGLPCILANRFIARYLFWIDDGLNGITCVPIFSPSEVRSVRMCNRSREYRAKDSIGRDAIAGLTALAISFANRLARSSPLSSVASRSTASLVESWFVILHLLWLLQEHLLSHWQKQHDAQLE